VALHTGILLVDNAIHAVEQWRFAILLGRVPRSGNGKENGDYGKRLGENFVHMLKGFAQSINSF